MRSDVIIEKYQKSFSQIFKKPIRTAEERVGFLRDYLSQLNEFLYERRKADEIDDLNSPDDIHTKWKRITPLLAIWDDYAEKIVGFSFDEKQIDRLAQLFVKIFKNSPKVKKVPVLKQPNKTVSELGGLSPKQFCLIRLMHALQDFSELQKPINEDLVYKIREVFKNDIPDEEAFAKEESARKLMLVFGGADRNVDERIRYIFSGSRIIKNNWNTTAYGIASKCNNDAKQIFDKLVELPGLKGKKAYMLLRDFYECGIWSYKTNLQTINIIPDNRVMRVALRTGIIRPALNKLLSSLLDEFDFQYGLTVSATQEGFRRVWECTKKYNDGKYVVPYPAGLDEFVFNLGDGRGGCCKPGAPSCKTKKRPPKFISWMLDAHKYKDEYACPFECICPDNTRDMLAPYAIQNKTWMNIFTGNSGGGGLRGI